MSRDRGTFEKVEVAKCLMIAKVLLVTRNRLRRLSFKKENLGTPPGDLSKNQVLRACSERFRNKVRTNGQNGPLCMTKLEAVVTQLLNKAASGDLKATKVLVQMASRFPELVTGPETFPTVTFKLV
jgi:hypothetical protein